MENPLDQLLMVSSCQRLSKHCRGVAFTFDSMDSGFNSSDVFGEKISAIMLWGQPGQVTLKVHFDLNAAAALTAIGMDRSEENLQEAVAIDFMREFSNLHAGSLRGLFEAEHIFFGVSLPFIMSGSSEKILRQQRRPNVRTASWSLTNGSHRIACTADIDMPRGNELIATNPRLEQAASIDTEIIDTIDGDVEFI